MLVPTRIGGWVGIQLAIAGLLIVGGAAAVGDALNAAAAWWMVYAVIVDWVMLGFIAWLIRREVYLPQPARAAGPRYGRSRSGALGVLAATPPAVAYGTEVTKAFYGDATLPMFAMVDVPVWASVSPSCSAPLLAELAGAGRVPKHLVAMAGTAYPPVLAGRHWLVVVILGLPEHAFYPLLTDDAGLDLRRVPRGLGAFSSGPRSTTRSADGCCRSWWPDWSSTVARLLRVAL